MFLGQKRTSVMYKQQAISQEVSKIYMEILSFRNLVRILAYI